MTVFRTICIFAFLMTRAIPAQRLAVSPASAALGKFPSWESRAAGKEFQRYVCGM